MRPLTLRRFSEGHILHHPDGLHGRCAREPQRLRPAPGDADMGGSGRSRSASPSGRRAPSDPLPREAPPTQARPRICMTAATRVSHSAVAGIPLRDEADEAGLVLLAAAVHRVREDPQGASESLLPFPPSSRTAGRPARSDFLTRIVPVAAVLAPRDPAAATPAPATAAMDPVPSRQFVAERADTSAAAAVMPTAIPAAIDTVPSRQFAETARRETSAEDGDMKSTIH